MTENPRTASEAPHATGPNDGASSKPATEPVTLREKLEAGRFVVKVARRIAEARGEGNGVSVALPALRARGNGGRADGIGGREC